MIFSKQMDFNKKLKIAKLILKIWTSLNFFGLISFVVLTLGVAGVDSLIIFFIFGLSFILSICYVNG